ncbi:MAG TPA: chemotaxis protein CheB [Pyrinomonadaceae bacterium]|jgi:two-component system chemotaxis response regulator CheB
MKKNSPNIIVIGASAGGFEALKKLVGGLPPDFQASLFVVWHMSPDVRGVLPHVLGRLETMPAEHAVDKEPIVPNRIYIAPPNFHLLVEKGRVRVTKGPKENRFRPAVDPLFRSAAYAYGARVIGVVLTGALDDGTSGLWMVKHLGGTAIVQDPNDAEVPSMPENALREVEVDFVVPIAEMADLLVRLSEEPIESSEVVMGENNQTEFEIKTAAEDSAFESGIMKFGSLTPFTCPDCHGVLFELKDGQRSRFRCHTGHAFSSDSLLTTVTENIEDSLWNAIRGIEESVMLLNHMGEHLANLNETHLATLYFKKAHEALDRVDVLRGAVTNHERLSGDSLRQLAGENGGNEKVKSE